MSTPNTPSKRGSHRFPSQGRHQPSSEHAAAPVTESERVLKIAGFPAVAALFQCEPERILRFFYEERMLPKVGTFCARMARMRRPYRLVSGEELARIAGTVRHGGIVAVAEPPTVLSLSIEDARRWARDRQPLFILDGIGNTHNLGAIARTLAFFGFKRMILSDHVAQAGLSESAHRVAEGGLEHLQVYRAVHLAAALERLKPYYRIVGTALTGGIPLEALPVDTRPTVVIFGNEEEGLPPATLKACESVVRLEGGGSVQSLNVSATAAILAYTLGREATLPRPSPQRAKPARTGRRKQQYSLAP